MKINKDNIHETKNLIINCAGELIAKYGYAKVTSKSICEKAKVNIAAINYHFGSRDKLYIEVLKEVHKYIINMNELNNLYLSNLSSKEKLENFIDIFVENLLDEEKWYIKVWSREIISSSPFISQILSQDTIHKLGTIAKIFSEYTKLTINDPKLYSCILIIMSPFFMYFLSYNIGEILPVIYSREELVNHLKKFAFAGLDAFKC